MEYIFEFRYPNGSVDTVTAPTRKKAIDLYGKGSITKREFIIKHCTIKNTGMA